MKSNGLFLLVLALLLSGCGISPQQKVDLSTVQSSGVSAATYDKMVHGDELSLSDMCGLECAQVDEGITLR